ncbi:MAG: cytochrome P450 [Chitinophagales bacterium]|nr:cytochrome P450 [Chitinophagales bacterium]MCZ2393298.1 cytochrome P450 [Chitinophagales bacterium]
MNIPHIKGNLLYELYLFASNPIAFLNSQFEKNGDIFQANIPTKRIICSRDPKWLEHIFVKKQKDYDKDFTMRNIEFILGKGLLTNTGDTWLKQRRLIQTAFYKGRLESLSEIMENVIDLQIEKIQKINHGQKIFIDKEMLELTATVALETIFGEKMSPELHEVQEKMAELQEYIVKQIKFPLYYSWTRLTGEHQKAKEKLRQINHTLYQIINKRKEHPDNQSFNLVSLLTQAIDAETGEKMSDQELIDELKTFYFAGHETTAFGLSWAIYELVQHPHIIQKIKEEVDSVLVNGKIGIEGLKKLKYTSAVVHESLRLHSPAYIISRECLKEDEIQGVKINKGDTIIISLLHLHRHPKLWDNPLQFNPNRFLQLENNSIQNWYPFGAGPRICIGKHFAMMEMTLAIAKIMSKINFKLYPQQKIEAEALITLKPKNGILLIKQSSS